VMNFFSFAINVYLFVDCFLYQCVTHPFPVPVHGFRIHNRANLIKNTQLVKLIRQKYKHFKVRINFVYLLLIFELKRRMKAYVFPGQGSQYPGMGKALCESFPKAREIYDSANDILGFDLKGVMFDGTAEDLLATKVTQPAVFVHSYSEFVCLADSVPDMVAGHSLGEFTALAAAGALSFEDALRLVSVRAQAMQDCCVKVPGSMAAIINLDASEIDRICREISENDGLGTVIPANYNSNSQTVISGTAEAVAAACEKMKAAGARRAIPLPVGGAFHSPLMDPARTELAEAISKTSFNAPVCPVYQNVTGEASADPEVIKANLLSQLTSPVRWTSCVINMASAGATEFVEFGSASTLQGLIRKTLPSLEGIVLRPANPTE